MNTLALALALCAALSCFVSGVQAQTPAPPAIVGTQPLKGDSRGTATEWNEFFHSKTGLFAANEAYTVSFDYKVLARDDDADFYTLVRHGDSGGNVGLQEWQGKTGDTGHITTRFATHEISDYLLIFGIHHGGAIAIDNIAIKTDPAHRPIVVNLPAPARTWQSPGHTTYYADSLHGDDAHDGKTAKTAWRSLDKINAGTFAPGDRILLRAGSQWTGFLAPGGSGAAGAPIILSEYGAGPKPRLDGQGKSLAALSLSNAEYWQISRLDIANRGPEPIPKLTGVNVSVNDFGTAHQIRLSDLDIHDVTGSNVKSEGGGSGISCSCGGGQVPSRFDGLTIANCHLTRTDRNGITMGGNWSRDHWFPSLGVVIRGNTLTDIGGDGIVPLACDGALVERNVLRGGRMRCTDYAAGIWPWSCDNTIIQYNEVSGMHGTNDGEGYDSDYNCRNTLFQYNVSHDNDGGFMLICDDGSQGMPWNIGDSGTVIHDNISRNDGLHTFNITGPCTNTAIYNNVFVIGKGQSVAAVASGNWGGKWASDTRFFNNVFYAQGEARFDLGGMTGTVFDHNAFWGQIAEPPADAHAVIADPKGNRNETHHTGIARRADADDGGRRSRADPRVPRHAQRHLDGDRRAGAVGADRRNRASAAEGQVCRHLLFRLALARRRAVRQHQIDRRQP